MLFEPDTDLARAFKDRLLIEPLSEDDVPDVTQAYALQEKVIRAACFEIAGWKIGATNPKSQSLMGLDGPFYGPIPAQACLNDGASCALPAGALGVEVEIAMRMAHDLPQADQDYGEEDVRAAIGTVHIALEVIGLRQRWEGVPEGRRAIADLGASCLFVHGASHPDLLGLPASSISARCLVDGEPSGSGDASAVLGHPLTALTWLANRGPGLARGQWISTGTLTGLTPVRPGSAFVGDFGHLGQVRLTFTD